MVFFNQIRDLGLSFAYINKPIGTDLMVKNNHYGVDTINSNLIVSINDNNNNNYTKH